ncbi:hypothetical protein ANN_06708 [Periplaneta americana]|uniref:NADH dehydrogenase [ubiquinone] 1 alpha subcomplex assembly factor 3 n=1 Tax=Periplaneta americana TaxID=6978 RepID=A0ABQ8TEF2_PERAM|nr:hypothetical protein ANN_06708 [Periplaneta americana]
MLQVAQLQDLLVLGVGDMTSNTKLNRNVLSFMAKHRINVEVLTTEQACATFNFLNAENRYIAGALIPPVTLRPSDEDVIMSKKKHKRLYISGDDENF